MSIFTLTNKENPCDICDDPSGKCRRHKDGEIALCMSLAGVVKKFEIVKGWKCLNPDNGKGWAIFKLDNTNEWSQQQREQWQREKQSHKQQWALQQATKQQQSLDVTERDRQYRQLLSELSLNEEDRQDLIRRGYTNQQIELSEIKSVEQWQRLKNSYSNLLPGVNATGTALLTQAGYLIPVRDTEGSIVGLQVRLRVVTDDSGRYRWLSSRTKKRPNGQSPHLYPEGCGIEGELPLAIYRPPGKPAGIALAEGTGAKPFLVSQRLNLLTIGAAGGQWASSPVTFKHSLDQASIELGGTKEAIVFLDAGDTANPSVMNRWRNVFDLLSEWGWAVKVGWWGQTSKNHDDIDELAQGQYKQIRYIDPSQLDKAVRLEEAWERWRKARNFTGEGIDEPFISKAIGTPRSDTATLIKSGLGTGKTTLIYRLLKELKDYGWISLGYRNNLLLQFIGEANDILKSIGEPGFYHYQDDLKGDAQLNLLLRDSQSKIACCIDSIIHFRPEDFEGKVLLLDEVESVVKQLLTGDTAINRWREKAKELLIEALKRADRVILCDGNLTDSTGKLIEELCGKRVVKIRNFFKGNCSNQVMFHLGGESLKAKLNKNDRSVFLQTLLNQISEGCFAVGSDSQIFVEALDKILKEMGLIGYRLDSTTQSEDWAKEFLRDAQAPQRFIEAKKPDYFLYSPTAECGVNINVEGYFQNLYFCFLGVLGTNEQLQMIKRIRDSEAEIHVFCKPVGFTDNGVSKSPFPNEIARATEQYIVDCGNASLEGLDEAEALNRYISQLVKISASNPYYKRECELRAVHNFEMQHLRDCLREALIESGYQLIEVSELQSKETEEQFHNTEQEIKDFISETIHTIPTTSVEEAEELVSRKQGKLTREERCQVVKARLIERLPGIQEVTIPATEIRPILAQDGSIEGTEVVEGEAPVFTPEFVKEVVFKDKTLIGRVELFYLLNHPEQAKRLQQDKWFWALSESLDDSPKPLRLSGYRSRWLKIKTLLDLGISKFWEPGFTWTSESPEAIAFYKACQNSRIARNTGFSPGKDKPAAFIGRVLKSLGFTTENSQPRQADGSKLRVYRVAATPSDDPIRGAILAAVTRRIEEKLAGSEVPDWQKISEQILEVQEASNPITEQVLAATPSAVISYKDPAEGVSDFESQREVVGSLDRSENPEDAITFTSLPAAVATDVADKPPEAFLKPDAVLGAASIASPIPVVEPLWKQYIGKLASTTNVKLGTIQQYFEDGEYFVTSRGEYLTLREILKGCYQFNQFGVC